MKALFVGDVLGMNSCLFLEKELPKIIQETKADITIVNAENSALHGITHETYKILKNAGADVLTSGNHMWDKPEVYDVLVQHPDVLRPLNWNNEKPGNGFIVVEKNEQKILVTNILGTKFMDPVLEDPLISLERLLLQYHLNENVNAIILDFHAEPAWEKQALACRVDGRISALLGTHTHVPTSDERILPKGTAYQSDIGMTGPYNWGFEDVRHESILHLPEAEIKIDEFRFAAKQITACYALLEIDDATGLSTKITHFKRGGVLNCTK